MRKFKANRAGFIALRNSSEVMADLGSRASRIAAAAGEGMEVRGPERGRQRARAAVLTATFPAMHREATDRALTRALEAGRG